MPNKITGGQGLFGDVQAASATITALTATTASITTPTIGGTAITATGAELNSVDLSAVGAIRKVKKISVGGAAIASSSENSTGFSLPTKCVVHNVLVDITTGSSAANTISVGLAATTSGDADGFLALVPSSSAGLLSGKLIVDTSGIVNQYWGALLATQSTATGAAVKLTAKHEPFLDANTSSKLVTYSMASATSAFVGAVLIAYTELA